MELKINEIIIPEKIDFNYEELKQELTEKVNLYETLIYNDDQIKQAKVDKANLNKLKRALNNERLKREREYMAPFNQFKAQINEIISIIDKPIAIIDRQIKEAEEQKKLEKARKIETLFEELTRPEWLKLESIYNSKWLNATCSMKSIREEIESRLEQINNDLDTLQNLTDFGFEATEVYKSTLDINRAVNEGKRLAEIQKRKEELKAEAEARAKAEEKVENNEINSQPDSQLDPEPINAQWISFSARLTISQAKELKKFFDDRNIEFKAI